MADDSSSSSSSDDDFLTLNDQGGAASSLDREALVRKKLLENFYGKSAVAEQQVETIKSAVPGRFDDDDDDDDHHEAKDSAVGKEDLDSPNFDAHAHTMRHVHNSSVQSLLATEDTLALQVRTLDSTMQTLVYENYSRFIDATDAIRSIGVNVAAHEEGLQRLTRGMNNIDYQSKSVEDALGTLRDQVAEKIRVKRLLTRLDALLKLPQTLREQIAIGKYREATTSFLKASSILSKHSEGFESLKTIETECNTILEEMKADLRKKLLHWGGRGAAYDDVTENDDDDDNVPDPPKSMSDIFECAGTLYLLIDNDDGAGGVEDLQSLSLSACIRQLDRLLDTHVIQVQDRRYAALDAVDTAPSVDLSGASLIPSDVLDAILEVTTLFGATFKEYNKSDLLEFVSDAFSSFLIHVRSILLEESIQAAAANQDAAGSMGIMASEEGQEEGVADAEAEISGALAILVEAVKSLACGLTRIDMSEDYANGLVAQVTDLAESMVRRRVDQKFQRLRQSIVQSCLIPFCDRSIAEWSDCTKTAKPAIPSLVQIASTMLSDCFQLVDDTIRSIVATASSSSSSTDTAILKDAIQASTHNFACWLASTLEMLSGGDASSEDRIIEPRYKSAEDEDESLEGRVLKPKRLSVEGLGDGGRSADDDAVLDLIDSAYKKLLSAGRGEEDSSKASSSSSFIVHSDFILALTELCRLAEDSVSDNLDQSIATHLGGGKRKSKSMFQDKASKAGEAANAVTRRFQVAASRMIVMYATNRGSEAADILCSGLAASKMDEDSNTPRKATWEALALVKKTALECASLFGDKARAGPVPQIEVSNNDFRSSMQMTIRAKTSLELDVERMFKEKAAAIYPHPSQKLEASRNAVLFLLLKVAFRSLVEEVRLSRVSAAGYQQLQIDSEFLKLLVPHYVSGDYVVQGSNACSTLSSLIDDVMSASSERCVDQIATENEGMLRQSREAVRVFMGNLEEEEDRFIVSDKEELPPTASAAAAATVAS